MLCVSTCQHANVLSVEYILSNNINENSNNNNKTNNYNNNYQTSKGASSLVKKETNKT